MSKPNMYSLAEVEKESNKDDCLPLIFNEKEYKHQKFEVSKNYKEKIDMLFHYRIMFKYFSTYFPNENNKHSNSYKNKKALIKLLSLLTFPAILDNFENGMIKIIAEAPDRITILIGIMAACLTTSRDQNEYLKKLNAYLVVNIQKHNIFFGKLCKSKVIRKFFYDYVGECLVLKDLESETKSDRKKIESNLSEFLNKNNQQIEVLKKIYYKEFGEFRTPFLNGDFYLLKS